MSVECQVHVKSQSELDIGGRETCFSFFSGFIFCSVWAGREYVLCKCCKDKIWSHDILILNRHTVSVRFESGSEYNSNNQIIRILFCFYLTTDGSFTQGFILNRF